MTTSNYLADDVDSSSSSSDLDDRSYEASVAHLTSANAVVSTSTEESDSSSIEQPDDGHTSIQRWRRHSRWGDTCCHRCGKRVYPVERVDVGALFHRRCFRCRVCGLRLSLVSYHWYPGDVFDNSDTGKKRDASRYTSLYKVASDFSRHVYQIPEINSSFTSRHNSLNKCTANMSDRNDLLTPAIADIYCRSHMPIYCNISPSIVKESSISARNPSRSDKIRNTNCLQRLYNDSSAIQCFSYTDPNHGRERKCPTGTHKEFINFGIYTLLDEMEESHRKGEEDLKAGFESERLRKIRFLEKDLKREMDDIIKGLVATFYKFTPQNNASKLQLELERIQKQFARRRGEKIRKMSKRFICDQRKRMTSLLYKQSIEILNLIFDKLHSRETPEDDLHVEYLSTAGHNKSPIHCPCSRLATLHAAPRTHLPSSIAGVRNHFCYVPSNAESFCPPPSHPDIKRRQLVSSLNEFKAIDNNVLQISRRHYSKYTHLVKDLMLNCETDLQKARAIFCWVTFSCMKSNVNVKQCEQNKVVNMQNNELIRGVVDGTETYHDVCRRLCSYAGLHCKVIDGYSKGEGYKPGMKLDGDRYRNSWTAVHIDGSWYFLNCHWGSGNTQCCYDEKYFHSICNNNKGMTPIIPPFGESHKSNSRILCSENDYLEYLDNRKGTDVIKFDKNGEDEENDIPFTSRGREDVDKLNNTKKVVPMPATHFLRRYAHVVDQNQFVGCINDDIVDNPINLSLSIEKLSNASSNNERGRVSTSSVNSSDRASNESAATSSSAEKNDSACYSHASSDTSCSSRVSVTASEDCDNCTMNRFFDTTISDGKDENEMSNGGTETRIYVFSCDDFYFITDPEDNIFQHFPDDPNWQLLESPITKREFINLPVLKSAFYKHGLKLGDHYDSKVNTKNNMASIIIKMPHLFNLGYTFKPKYDGMPPNNLAGRVLCRFYGRNALFTIAPPKRGGYYFTVYVRNESVSRSFQSVCVFQIRREESESRAAIQYPELSFFGPTPNTAPYDFQPISHVDPLVSCSTEDITFKFQLSRRAKTIYSLQYYGYSSYPVDEDIQRYVFMQHRDDTTLSILVRCPKLGNYVFSLHGKHIISPDDTETLTHVNDQGNCDDSQPYFQCFFRYLIQCTKSSSNKGPFPRACNRWYKSRLQEPLMGDLKAGVPVTFRVVVPVASSVVLQMKDEWHYLSELPDNLWVTSVVPKRTDCGVKLFGQFSLDTTSFFPLLEFQVT